MKRLIPRVTVRGKVLILATVVAGVVVALTGWTPAVIALALLLLAWVSIYLSSDPGFRRRTGEDPARAAEQRWNLD